ncbi:hypothetical protein [Desulfotomaculum copahuensis]|uniref:Uncharacterized protein n=1 Tax=Desulfotomaculum copahuensis TaxID=1838280 RepID=A0A1B7LE96_9FIRM|nr:hypothetical protein [Desulfotomaculum copahuensis]OAT81421.1 hypothetical protein A6M21_11165 [Desulfotomaculum copahuensis]
MLFFPANKPAQSFLPPRAGYGECHRQDDQAEIRIGDVVVSMTRRSNLRVPAEFSAFVPRAEIRRRFENGQLSEEEITLSGITLVHAPRYREWKKKEPSGAPGPAPPRRRGAPGVFAPDATSSSGGNSAPDLVISGQMFPVRFSSPPVKSWGDPVTWNGAKVAAVEKCVPRININGRGKSSGKGAAGDGGRAGD